MTADWVHGRECPGCQVEMRAHHARQRERLELVDRVRMYLVLGSAVVITAAILIASYVVTP